MGSRGSRRLTGRASVGFALAPLEEVANMRVEVVSRSIDQDKIKKKQGLVCGAVILCTARAES